MCIVITIFVLMNWEMMCRTCSKQIVKYNQRLDYILEIILCPAVVLLRLFLSPLEPLYKTCLPVKPQSKFSLVKYFWSLASKVFLSTVMTCLFLYYSTLLNLGTTQTLLAVSKHYSVTMYSAGIFLIVIAVGENFDATSNNTTGMFFPVIYLLLGLMLAYSCVKMVEFHHPGFLFSMVLRSKRFVTSILVIDVTGKSLFTFAP